MIESPNINQLVDHLFRHESGKMVAVLSRLLGLQNLETAQWYCAGHIAAGDAIVEVILRYRIILLHGCIAWQRIKPSIICGGRKKFRDNISPQYAYLLQSEWTLSPIINQLFLENEIEDSQLRMMFACCHPSIPPESQVALTLKTLCGLSGQWNRPRISYQWRNDQ